MLINLRLILSMLLLALFACSSEPALSPEETVREWVHQVETAAREKQLNELKKYIASDYQDSQGNDRQKLLLTARLLFKNNETIGISNKILDIHVSGDTAIVRTHTIFSGNQISASLGITEAKYQFSVNLVKNGNKWQATSITYQ